MPLISKVIGRNDERRSRLHTRRGDWAPAGILGALLRRRATATSPWMAPNAVERLNELLTRDMTLLELGSGSSTAWYAGRVGSVVSIEPDAQWAEKTSNSLRGLDNVKIVTSSVAVALPAAEPANVVIVDHNDEDTMTRVDALDIAVTFANIIVLDDSDRKQYARSDQVMADWKCERYVAFLPRPLIPTETTIFLRP